MMPIVVMAHARPASLERLLASVAAMDRPAGTELVVLLDPGSPVQRDVERVVAACDWPADRLELIEADRPLGLVGNFRRVGELAEQRGPLLLLEDDLEVAPGAHRWAEAIVDRYRSDPLVAGATLNALWFNGFSHRPFEPIPDGTDVFFAAVPWYQGMVVTPEWWRIWWRQPSAAVDLHPVYDTFAEEEWFPEVARNVAGAGRFFVYPRVSQAINHGEAGVHFADRTSWFQTPLERRFGEPRLCSAAQSLARYDQYLEYDVKLLAEALNLGSGDLPLVDLTATRPLPAEGGLLTVRPTNSATRTWGSSRRPLEANVLDDCAGSVVSLTDATAIDRSSRARWATDHLLDLAAGHGRAASLRVQLRSRLAARSLRRGAPGTGGSE